MFKEFLQRHFYYEKQGKLIEKKRADSTIAIMKIDTYIIYTYHKTTLDYFSVKYAQKVHNPTGRFIEIPKHCLKWS